MKKISIAICAAFVAISLLLSGASVRAQYINSGITVKNYHDYGYIKISYAMLDTPLNMNVVSAYYYREGITSNVAEVIAQKNEELSEEYPLAYRLSTSTPEYNCHSYAWHSQNVSENKFWINDPSAYYENQGYEETLTPKVGDIICYMDVGSNYTDSSDDKNLHSGVIVGIISSTSSKLGSTYIVESKWGGGSLNRHNGFECPYTTYKLRNGSAYSFEMADYLVFYTRVGHNHNHNTYQDYADAYYHRCICSCGQIIHSEHNWVEHRINPQSISAEYGDEYSINYVPAYRCTDCGAITLQDPGTLY